MLAKFLRYSMYALLCVSCSNGQHLSPPPTIVKPTVIHEVPDELKPLAADSTSTGNEWDTYIDSRGYFTVSMPAGWTVQPPTDFRGGAYAALVWQFAEDTQDAPRKITIGRAIPPIENDQSLEAWVTSYESSEQIVGQIKTSPETLDGLEALSVVEQILPNGLIMNTYVRCGNRVWFIWTMSEQNEAPKLAEIYMEFLDSFHLTCDIS